VGLRNREGAVAFILIVAGAIRPGPASISAGPAEPVGAFRIARHPVLMGFALFGVLDLLANLTTTDVAFFAGFPLTPSFGRVYQDRRKLAYNLLGYASFVAATPFVPFTGRETLRGLRELGPLPLVV
jgi:uncharacterized membrane protein